MDVSLEGVDIPKYEMLLAKNIAALESGIRWVQIAIFLPYLLYDVEEMKQKLSMAQIKNLYKLTENYIKDAGVKGQKTPLTEHEIILQLDHRLLKAVQLIDEHFSANDLATKYYDVCTPKYCLLYGAFIDFKIIYNNNLTIQSITDISRDHSVKTRQQGPKQKSKEGLDIMQQILREKEATLRGRIAIKQASIKNLQEDLAFKKFENMVKLKKLTIKANQEMEAICAESDAKQGRLQEEVEKARIKYEAILKQNTIKDKKLRDKKNKLQLQLQSLIKKFDVDVIEKYRGNDKLDEQREIEQELLDQFMVVFKKQEEEYIILKTLTDKRAERKFQKKLRLFMMTRAAKIIQRAWRKYIKRKKKKEAANKGKKK